MQDWFHKISMPPWAAQSVFSRLRPFFFLPKTAESRYGTVNESAVMSALFGMYRVVLCGELRCIGFLTTDFLLPSRAEEHDRSVNEKIQHREEAQHHKVTRGAVSFGGCRKNDKKEETADRKKKMNDELQKARELGVDLNIICTREAKGKEQEKAKASRCNRFTLQKGEEQYKERIGDGSPR